MTNVHSPRSLRRAIGTLILTGAALAGTVLGTGAAPVTQPTFADPAFQRTWERYDRPVFRGETSRSFTWGNQISGSLQEKYNEGPSGRHLVQYFDKSRMEINDPNGNQNSAFFVTQGLLARDMIRGEIQEGNTAFRGVQPAEVPFGDLDDTAASSPTYASFKKVLNEPPIPEGNKIAAAIDRNGNVSNTADPRGVTSAGVVPGVTTNHSIASVFYAFLQSSGPVYENGQNVNAAIFSPTFYVTGYPITEAYWARVKAAGQYKDVLIQCFERRCLTYTPSNDPAFQVELANTGLQYYSWRYPQTVNDGQAPKLSGLAVSNMTATSVMISWKTDEPATTEVRYGVTDQYDRLVGDLTLVKDHAITLTGLEPNQNYHFVISSADAAGNRATNQDATFKTTNQTQVPTLTAPTVTPAATSARIVFTTNPATTAEVTYFVTGSPAQTTTYRNTTSSTSHDITLNGLMPGTSYTYRITISSNSGQFTSDDATFTTTAVVP